MEGKLNTLKNVLGIKSTFSLSSQLTQFSGAFALSREKRGKIIIEITWQLCLAWTITSSTNPPICPIHI